MASRPMLSAAERARAGLGARERHAFAGRGGARLRGIDGPSAGNRVGTARRRGAPDGRTIGTQRRPRQRPRPRQAGAPRCAAQSAYVVRGVSTSAGTGAGCEQDLAPGGGAGDAPATRYRRERKGGGGGGRGGGGGGGAGAEGVGEEGGALRAQAPLLLRQTARTAGASRRGCLPRSKRTVAACGKRVLNARVILRRTRVSLARRGAQAQTLA